MPDRPKFPEGLSFAVAVIMNEKDELLLLHRSESSHRDPGKWGLSGGRLESDESPEKGMLRELREELGTEIVLREVARLGPLPAIASKERVNQTGIAQGGTAPVGTAQVGVVHLFHYIRVSGMLRLNHEHTDYRWVNPEAYGRIQSAQELMPGVDEDLSFFGIWPGRSSPTRRASDADSQSTKEAS